MSQIYIPGVDGANIPMEISTGAPEIVEAEPISLAEELSGVQEEPVGDGFKSEANPEPKTKTKPTLEEKYNASAEKYNKTFAECEAAKDKMIEQEKSFNQQKKMLKDAEKAKKEAAKKMKEAKVAASKAKTTEEAAAILKSANSEYKAAVGQYKAAVSGYNNAATAYNSSLGQYSSALRTLRGATKEVRKFEIRIAENQAKEARKLAAGKTATEAQKQAAKTATEGVKALKGEWKAGLANIRKDLLKNWFRRDALPFRKGGAFSPKRVLLGEAIVLVGLVLGAVYKRVSDSKNVNASADETPAANAQTTETPAANAQETETPAANAQTTETPAANAQETETPAAETPAANAQTTETPAANSQATETPAAEETVPEPVETIDENKVEQELANEAAELTYTVKKGDNLWNIAKKELTEKNGQKPTDAQIVARVGELMDKNGLHWEADHYVVLIFPGQTLKM